MKSKNEIPKSPEHNALKAYLTAAGCTGPDATAAAGSAPANRSRAQIAAQLRAWIAGRPRKSAKADAQPEPGMDATADMDATAATILDENAAAAANVTIGTVLEPTVGASANATIGPSLDTFVNTIRDATVGADLRVRPALHHVRPDLPGRPDLPADPDPPSRPHRRPSKKAPPSP